MEPGCPDLAIYHQSSPRHLKNFAKQARCVCTRWQSLIDQPSSINLKDFWVSVLTLRCHSFDRTFENILEEQGRPDRGFVVNMAKFWNQLKTSNGCSLEVYLSFQTSGVPGSALEFLLASEFVHGIHLLTPYQHQITRISFDSNWAAIHMHFLQFLSFSVNGPYCPFVSLTCGYGPTLEYAEVKDASSIDGFDCWLPLTRARVASLSHLTNMEILDISHYTFFDKNLGLPPDLKLGITTSGGMMEVLNHLKFHEEICPNLARLTIDLSQNYDYYTQDPKKDPLPPPKPIRLHFPNLEHLTIISTTNYAVHFLGNDIYCPRLKSLVLKTRDDFLEPYPDRELSGRLESVFPAESHLPPATERKHLSYFRLECKHSTRASFALLCRVQSMLQVYDLDVSFAYVYRGLMRDDCGDLIHLTELEQSQVKLFSPERLSMTMDVSMMAQILTSMELCSHLRTLKVILTFTFISLHNSKCI